MRRVRCSAVRRNVLVGWMLLASASPAALAQTTPSAPARSLRAIEVQTELTRALELWAGQTGTGQLKPRGTIDVQDEAGGGIRVILPEMVIEDAAGHLIIPPITYIEATPADGRRGMRVQLPDRIVWKAAAPAESLVLTIGRQRMEGVWLDDGMTFEKADALLADLTLGSDSHPKLLQIAEIALVQDLVERNPGSWSGRQSVSVKGVQLSDGTANDVRIGAIESATDTADARLIDYATRLKAAGLTPMSPPPSNLGGEAELTQMRRLVELARDLPVMLASVASVTRISDLSVRTKGPSAPADVALSGLTIRWGAGGEGNGKLKIALGFDLEKLILDGDIRPPRHAELLPHSVGLGLTIDEVPGGALWALLTGNFAQAVDLQIAALREQTTVEPEPDDTGQPPTDEVVETEEEEEDTDEETTDEEEDTDPATTAASEAMDAALTTSLVMALPVLAEQPPRLTLDRLDILGTIAGMKAGGSIRYNPQAQYSAVGAVDITLTGLDKVIDIISKAPPKSEEREALPVLAALRGVAQAEVADNSIVHRLRVEIPVQGEITINGMPLDALLNPQKQKPQKKK